VSECNAEGERDGDRDDRLQDGSSGLRVDLPAKPLEPHHKLSLGTTGGMRRR
jgi:hypothetical protein